MSKLYVGEIGNTIIDAYACDPTNAVFFWGAPGIGKTQAVYQIKDKMSATYQCDFFIKSLITSQMESIDFFIPALDRDGTKKMYIKVANNTFVLPHDARGIIFFDELSNASPDVQKAVQSIITDRMIGDTRIPDGIMFVCAGNRREDRAGSNGLLSALANRVEHYDTDATFEDWMKWATAKGLHHSIISYLYISQGDLNLFDAAKLRNPTPRIWAKAAKYMDYYEATSAPDNKIRRRLGALLGDEVAGKVMQHRRCFEKFPTKEEIMKDPMKAKLPDEMDVRYALAIAIYNWLAPKNTEAMFKFMTRFNVDFQGMFFKLVREHKPEMLQASETFTKWGRENRALLSQ